MESADSSALKISKSKNDPAGIFKNPLKSQIEEKKAWKDFPPLKNSINSVCEVQTLVNLFSKIVEFTSLKFLVMLEKEFTFCFKTRVKSHSRVNET